MTIAVQAPAGVTVEPGIVSLRGVSEVLTGTDGDVHIYEIDCTTSRPRRADLLWSVVGGRQQYDLTLTADNQTLRVNDTQARPTKITFPVLDGDWEGVLDTRRSHVIRVVLYRRTRGTHGN